METPIGARLLTQNIHLGMEPEDSILKPLTTSDENLRQSAQRTGRKAQNTQGDETLQDRMECLKSRLCNPD